MHLYDPFLHLTFSSEQCFLCGNKTAADISKIPVFPNWVMQRYKLNDQPFKLLDENVSTYGDLKMPCCKNCLDLHITKLDETIHFAVNNGYEGLAALSEIDLFLWFSKLLYGIVWVELQAAFAQHDGIEPLGISPSLISKFRNLHLLLQALNRPLIYEDFQPWSIFLVRMEEKKEAFEYRDEMATMIFSLNLEDFGFIICLQDHGHNKIYHKALLSKIKEPLSEQQFQELCAQFYYSAYLFNPIPEYLVIPPAGNELQFTICVQPLEGAGFRPLFNKWDNAVYAQVLEAFWKPWNISKKEILEIPDSPLSVIVG